MGVEKSLKRPTIFAHGVCKKCSEPEAVGNFITGVEEGLRRPTTFVSGAHNKCSEPEAVDRFIMGVDQSLHDFREWSAQKVLRA